MCTSLSHGETAPRQDTNACADYILIGNVKVLYSPFAVFRDYQSIGKYAPEYPNFQQNCNNLILAVILAAINSKAICG